MNQVGKRMQPHSHHDSAVVRFHLKAPNVACNARTCLTVDSSNSCTWTFLRDPGDLKIILRSAIETAKPIVDEAMQCYDDLIHQIEESEAWRN